MKLLDKLATLIINLWPTWSSPFQVEVDEYEAVVFFKNGKVVDVKGGDVSPETLNNLKRAFRAMDRASEHMDSAFKEMDDAFLHMKRTIGKEHNGRKS